MPNSTFEEICLKKVEKSTYDKLKILGENIKKIRLEKNLTQSDVAFYIYTDKSLISSLERGSCKNITLNSIMRIATLFNINIAVLFNEEYES